MPALGQGPAEPARDELQVGDRRIDPVPRRDAHIGVVMHHPGHRGYGDVRLPSDVTDRGSHFASRSAENVTGFCNRLHYTFPAPAAGVNPSHRPVQRPASGPVSYTHLTLPT